MKRVDLLLSLLFPTLILLHLLVAPYTKVEESFNIQATHDILAYGTPSRDVFSRLRSTYDHFEFPGAVPRTFLGAILLAGVSRPIISIVGSTHAQLVVRAVLGLFNAFALLRYKNGVERAFGRDVGKWYVLLQAGQFHVIYYASRTLPNMFAFGLTTLALREFLPVAAHKAMEVKRQRSAIYLLVLAGVIFRSEIALLLFAQLSHLFIFSRISLQTIIPASLQSALIALAISMPIDSYFWQRPIWPELAGFYYNAIQGKSADWGTSPIHYYFSSVLPRLLLNPMTTLLIPLSIYFPSRARVSSIIAPAFLFIAIYSLQPHKESRFIIYAVPPLTACASLSASYIWTRRSKSLFYRLASLVLLTSVICAFAASTVMLGISSLNYPGGDALSQLHDVIKHSNSTKQRINVHIDVLSCMTGVTRFQQYRSWSSKGPSSETQRPIHIYYDKTEDEETLLSPAFWERFDYVLAESPEKVIGKWDVVSPILGYAGIGVLRPNQEVEEGWGLEKLYEANRGSGMVSGEEVREKVDHMVAPGENRFQGESTGKWGIYRMIRDRARVFTGGWWVGPRMEPKIWILRGVKELLL